MLDILIVEDVKKIRETLTAMVTANYTDVQIVGQCDSITEAYNLITRLKPHLVFLDINLTDGEGFELLDRLPNKNFSTIIITGNKDRAIEAIKHDAVDYILKPISPTELYKAIDKVKAIVAKTTLSDALQFMTTNLKSIKTQQKLILKTATIIHSVLINDIVRCESDGKYTSFYLVNDKRIVMSTPIKEYEEQLAVHNFFRVHQSHLINMLYFDAVIKQPELLVLLSNGDKVALADRKKTEFLQFINTAL